MAELLPLYIPLFLYLLMVVGIGLIFRVISTEIKNSRSRSWPSTTGKVISSEVKREAHTEGGVSYSPRVRYEYRVGNQTYESTRISFELPIPFADLFNSGKRAAEAKVKEYFAGREVVVYYDPHKPKTAMLEPGGSADGAGLSIALFITLMGICWLFWLPPVREVLPLLMSALESLIAQSGSG